MAYLRSLKVKGKEYLYYCIRKRSNKKKGGDGNVKSMDFCLGSIRPLSILDKLPCLLYKHIDIKEFVTAFLEYCNPMPDKVKILANFTLDKKERITGISAKLQKISKDIDLRTQYFRNLRQELNGCLHSILEVSHALDKEILDLAAIKYAQDHYRNRINETEKKLNEQIVKDSPDLTDNFQLVKTWWIEYHEEYVSKFSSELNRILSTYVPKKEQSIAREQFTKQALKLSTNNNALMTTELWQLLNTDSD